MEREFLQLFQGYENAYSTYVIKTAQRGNKVETTNKFINGTLEEKHISAHFKGIRGIGSVPLKSDNSLSYGCIDVDDYTINVEELEASVINNELPLLVCYSKSGGAHLFVFFKELFSFAIFLAQDLHEPLMISETSSMWNPDAACMLASFLIFSRGNSFIVPQ